MSESAPAVPGFRSLSQAGIQLRERGDQPEPQVPSSQVDAHGRLRAAGSVAVLPREPGTKRPLPRDRQPIPHSVLPGTYVGHLPSVEFSCPACGVVLTITEPSAYHGQAGPCPHCAAVVLPPRVVSPFSEAEAPAPDKVKHFSGFAM